MSRIEIETFDHHGAYLAEPSGAPMGQRRSEAARPADSRTGQFFARHIG